MDLRLIKYSVLRLYISDLFTLFYSSTLWIPPMWKMDIVCDRSGFRILITVQSVKSVSVS